MPQITLSLADVQGPEQVVPALKILLLFTILSIAPAILISMTSFTRIVIVFSFLRQALGSQNVPPIQVIMALSLLLTGVVMTPVAQRIDTEAFEPYVQKQLDEKQAFERAALVARDFLVPQTREADLRLFYELNHTQLPKTQAEVGLHLLVPAFMISELRTAFEMGFLIFLPFVLIDLIVASILTAMGMVMLPPTMLATPLKLLLFVVVDGWSLLSRSLVASFG
ncbi:MAG TPA: flagellar type III secretion system pore protein FliP [Polyangiales bacterium]|nr:flagellar type III secretion system pore protein FliP [Polyangiales bacterium]